MIDPSFSLILPFLQTPNEKILWVVDENAQGVAGHIRNNEKLRCITNRYDIFEEMNGAGIDSAFSDYDFSDIVDGSLDLFVYRVSKERAVVHHVINNALRCLTADGRLILVGEKGDGIKGYSDKAGKLFSVKANAKKNGLYYLAQIPKHTDYESQQQTDCLLDDKCYSSLRPTDALKLKDQTLELYSKPGQFGWNKQDQGSELLIDTAEQYFSEREFPGSVLDLGCGYGFLTLKTKYWRTTIRVATDNNAAALASAKKNFSSASMDVTLYADDCGKDITDAFDCVLCNPPFHQGFANDSELTKKFLSNAARLISSNGVALFVVNQFIPLEKLAAMYFGSTQQLASDGQFKIVVLRRNT
ncbi:MAG: methyltransferase [Cellvibrionaceae bacterium]